MIDDDAVEQPQEPTRFAVLPSVAIDDKRLSHAACRVLLKLASYSDRDGWAWPRQSEIADALGMSRTTVVDHIGGLEQLGYIEVERRFYEHGGQRSSRYRLVYDRWSHRRQSASEEPTDGVGPADREGRTGRQTGSDRPTPATRRRPETTGTGTPEQTTGTGDVSAARRSGGNPRVTQVIDALRAAGVPDGLSPRDLNAIKGSTFPAGDMAQAYIDLHQGRGWGPRQLAETPSMCQVAWHMAAWYRSRHNPNRQDEFTRGQVIRNQ